MSNWVLAKNVRNSDKVRKAIEGRQTNARGERVPTGKLIINKNTARIDNTEILELAKGNYVTLLRAGSNIGLGIVSAKDMAKMVSLAGKDATVPVAKGDKGERVNSLSKYGTVVGITGKFNIGTKKLWFKSDVLGTENVNSYNFEESETIENTIKFSTGKILSYVKSKDKKGNEVDVPRYEKVEFAYNITVFPLTPAGKVEIAEIETEVEEDDEDFGSAVSK